MGHPFEGWSKLNEGWDGGNIAIDELFDNVKLVASSSAKTIGIAIGVLWGTKLLLSLLIFVFAALGFWVTKGLGSVAGILSYVAIVVAVIVGALQQSLYRPLQLQAFEGSDFVGGPVEALKLAKDVVVKVAITMFFFGLSVGLGLLACGFGALFAMFFFLQAPYLAATTELSPWECMRRSYELNKSYAAPVAIVLAVALFGSGVLTGCGGAIVGFIGGLLMSAAPPIGGLLINAGSDLLSLAAGLLVIIVSGGVFTTIQSVERGIAFKRD